MIIPDLPAPRGLDKGPLFKMISQWAAKRSRNRLREVYADGKNALRDFGISLPPQMRNIEIALEWPAKAVLSLASRCNFDGFVVPDVDRGELGISDLIEDNNLHVTLPQAIQSALIHSVSFITVSPGDTSRGEPEILMLPKRATEATGLWDPRTNSLSDGLSVTDTNDDGFPTEIVWYAREHVTTFRREPGGKWETDTQDNPLRRVWMEPLPFRPSLHRPFGRSRISRTVMSLTDAAMRSLARAEGHAEFFASPQRYALGADDDAFDGHRWDAVMSRFLSISKDEDGDVPTLGQFSQMSMQPHFDHLKTLASMMAGETGLPLSSFGVVGDDNQTSADAILAAKEDLVIEAGSANRVWGRYLCRMATTARMMREGTREIPAEMRGIAAHWQSPATPSVVSASDAVLKQVQAFPWMVDSEVPLEMLGYDEPSITRLTADKRRSQSRMAMAGLRVSQRFQEGEDADEG